MSSERVLFGKCAVLCCMYFLYRAEQVSSQFIVVAHASMYLMSPLVTTGLLFPLATLPFFQPPLQEEDALH